MLQGFYLKGILGSGQGSEFLETFKLWLTPGKYMYRQCWYPFWSNPLKISINISTEKFGNLERKNGTDFWSTKYHPPKVSQENDRLNNAYWLYLRIIKPDMLVDNY